MTVLVVSDGVSDNIGDTHLPHLMNSAYTKNWSPNELAQRIVGDASIEASKPGQSPDDTSFVASCSRKQKKNPIKNAAILISCENRR